MAGAYSSDKLYNALVNSVVKYADISCSFRGGIFEAVSLTHEKLIEGEYGTIRISPVKLCIQESVDSDMLIGTLYILNVPLKTLTGTLNEMERLLSSLSWYGNRSIFCRGLTTEEVKQQLFELPSLKFVDFPNYPHFRHRRCLQFYPARSSKQSPFELCPACSRYMTGRRQKLKKTTKSFDEATSARSHVNYSCLVQPVMKARLDNLRMAKKKTNRKIRLLMEKLKKRTEVHLNFEESDELRQITGLIAENKTDNFDSLANELPDSKQSVSTRKILEKERLKQQYIDVNCILLMLPITP